MKVGDTAIFTQAVFVGPVSFTGADIARQFVAWEARFNNLAFFTRLKVGDSAVFTEAVFKGPGFFLGEEIAHDFKAPKASFTTLDLLRTTIRGAFEIEDVALQKISATLLRVEGLATLKNLTITGQAHLEHSNFGILNLCNVRLPDVSKSLPNNSKSLQLDGMTYQYIS